MTPDSVDDIVILGKNMTKEEKIAALNVALMRSGFFNKSDRVTASGIPKIYYFGADGFMYESSIFYGEHSTH